VFLLTVVCCAIGIVMVMTVRPRNAPDSYR